MLTTRGGFTLVELLVAMLIGGIVLSMLASLSARQQRLDAELGLAGGREEQLQQTEALLPIELRSVAPGEGDITPGSISDTAIQFRATIATGVVCDTASQSVSLSPIVAYPALVSVLMAPAAGDTLWSLSLSDSGESWVGHAISNVGTDHGGCLVNGVDALNGLRGLTRTVLHLAPPSSGAPLSSGTPVRVTRLARLSLYRSSDGDWYLGDRQWNSATGRFDAIQPLSGPFQSPARAGLTFQFADTLGRVIASGSPSTQSIALIQVSLLTDSDAVNLGRHVFVGESRALFSIALRNRVR